MTNPQLLIGGQWTPARSGETEEIRSPYDGSVVGEVSTAGLADVELAVAAAVRGAAVWRRTSAHARMRILLQEHARPGDTVVAAAGGPPGDLQKVWDATEGRFCHLEFGFSCMGYEIPAGMGVRLADPNPDSRVVVFIGDGTFLMSPTELVTAAQESIAVTVVIPENRGYQVIHRLQMGRHGREFGNEFRYRTSPLDLTAEKNGRQPRLDGDYLEVDLVQVAAGLGARAVRADTAADVRAALDDTRGHQRPVVIVVPVIPHVDLPGAGAWWDVAPSEVSEDETVQRLRVEYEAGLSKQLWFG